MIQQSHYWAYSLRKPQFKTTYYPSVRCSTIYNSQDMKLVESCYLPQGAQPGPL